MKKRWYIPLLVAFTLCGTIFGILYGREMGRREERRQMAQASAANAYEEFVEYQRNGHSSSYWYGVAEFRAFQTAYHMLVEGTNKATNFTFCNEVYGSLVLAPEKSQENIDDIVDVMEILSVNVEDDAGYARMDELRHRLSQ